MKKAYNITFLLVAMLFAINVKAQIPNQTLRYYAVLTGNNFINNNPNLIKGKIGALGSIIGLYANPDSVIRTSNSELSTALIEMDSLKSFLNTNNGIELSNLDSELTAGTYTIPFNLTTDEFQNIKLTGSDTDIIIINIDGDLIFEESTNIILDGIRPENVYWNIGGIIKIKSHSWIYGTFVSNGEIIVYNDVDGAFSTFSDANITIGNVTALASYHYLTIKIDLSNGEPCAPTCIVSNLINNGDFSDAPVCNDIFYSNEFNSDLRYKYVVGSDPCNNPSSRPSFYKLDNELAGWNKDSYKLISDHTGDDGNLFFVDGFYQFRPDNAYSTSVHFDTSNVIIWEQQIYSVFPGKTYSFSFWSTNINRIQNSDLKLRFLIDDIEIPNTRYTIVGNDIKWRQHCFKWQCPPIGSFPSVIKITIKQVDNFGTTSAGKDVVIDDIVFGEMSVETISITSTVTSNYCTGNNTTLTVVNPKSGYTYQWMLNGSNINGATGSTYIATLAGNYSVTGSSNLGCLLSSNSIAVTIVTLTGENLNVSVTSSDTWTSSSNPLISSNGKVWIKNSMSIAPGVNLKIKGMRFEFSPNAIVYVHAGATLTLESENGIPTVFTAYNCTYTMWNGIKIYSTLSANGKVVINPECVIEHARIGVSNESTNYKTKVNYTGYVEATGAIFRNNYIAVQLISKSAIGSGLVRDNKSKFISCQFITDAILKDAIAYPDGRHKTFVDLQYINRVYFNSNNFKNSILYTHPLSVNNVYDEAKVTQNKGITSIASTYKISLCEFINLWVGVDFSSGSSLFTDQNFQSSNFKSDAYGIILRGGAGIKVEGCTFMVDPNYNTGSSEVPKFFIGINSRGSVGYTFTKNLFYDGYCGIISKSASNKNFKSNIFKNTFLDVGKNNKGAGQGIYMLGPNSNVQVKCNTFISSDLINPVQNHWVLNGMMSDQGVCISSDKSAPAGNRFEQNNPVNADIYIENDENSFFYRTHNTSIAEITPLYLVGSTNMTTTYVTNCTQQYVVDSACFDSKSREINLIRDDINFALINENTEELSELLFEATQYFEENDSTGESTIEFLNETPHSIAKWMLVARYIQAERYNNANDLLEILPVNTEEEQAEQTFYQLLVQLENNDASIIELDQNAKDILTELAESEFYVSYEAQGILHYLYGNAYYIPLPYIEESMRPILNPEPTDLNVTQFSVFPNPSTGFITIMKPSDVAIKKVELQNINGSVILENSSNTDNQLDLGKITNGMYIVAIYTANGERIMKKLIISK